MDSYDTKAAHTAEHAFIGSLQKLFGHTLKVRKVSHSSVSDISTAFIVIPQLDMDLVFKAESEVNSLISQGRKITETHFESLSEAKAKVPNLRANEERIIGKVRVVEIENHDVTACAVEHVENLKECEFLLVTRISKSGNEYEVDFAVGKKAKEIAVELSVKLLRLCNEIGANINTIENTVKKLKTENETLSKKAKSQTRERLAKIQSENLNGSDLFKGIFYNLVDEEILEFTGEKILREKTLVIIVNRNENSEMANIVFARNEKLSKVDCNKLFKEIAGQHGRGGGKPHFVRGMINEQESENIVNKLALAISNLSY